MRRARFLLPLAAVLLAGCAATGTVHGRPAIATFSPPVPSASTLTASPPVPTPALVTASPPALLQVHDPGQVTGTLTGPCHASDGGQLPDPSCTPGAYDPQVTAAVLCAPGYSTSAYRAPESQTSAFKWQVAEPAYGQQNVAGELDHLVSLELGGANDASNLWVEAGPVPNAKDTVENALHAWVCAVSGTEAETRLHEAQVAIASDWMTAEQVLRVT